MKCVWLFLVLAMVMVMAEPGDAFFSRIKSAFREAKQARKEHKRLRDMEKMNRRYGPNWQQKLSQPHPAPPAPAEVAPGEPAEEENPFF